MRRDKDGYFVLILGLVIVVALGGLYALISSGPTEEKNPPTPPPQAPPPAPAEILQLSRVPEADDFITGLPRAAFKVKNVSSGIIREAMITIVLLDPDDDVIRRISFSVGRFPSEGSRSGQGCDSPLRPGDYCLRLEMLQEQEYRRMARCTVSVKLEGSVTAPRP